MYDRTACHKILDRILNEISKGEKYVRFSIDSNGIEIMGKTSKEIQNEYDIRKIVYNDQSFSDEDADTILRFLDRMDKKYTEQI